MSGWSDDCPIRASDKVLSQVLDGEAVLLDLGSGTYFGLNEVGTTVWSLFGADGKASVKVGRMLEHMVASYQVEEAQARQDLGELLDDLLDKGLIIRDPSAP